MDQTPIFDALVRDFKIRQCSYQNPVMEAVPTVYPSMAFDMSTQKPEPIMVIKGEVLKSVDERQTHHVELLSAAVRGPIQE